MSSDNSKNQPNGIVNKSHSILKDLGYDVKTEHIQKVFEGVFGKSAIQESKGNPFAVLNHIFYKKHIKDLSQLGHAFSIAKESPTQDAMKLLAVELRSTIIPKSASNEDKETIYEILEFARTQRCVLLMTFVKNIHTHSHWGGVILNHPKMLVALDSINKNLALAEETIKKSLKDWEKEFPELENSSSVRNRFLFDLYTAENQLIFLEKGKPFIEELIQQAITISNLKNN